MRASRSLMNGSTPIYKLSLNDVIGDKRVSWVSPIEVLGGTSLVFQVALQRRRRSLRQLHHLHAGLRPHGPHTRRNPPRLTPRGVEFRLWAPKWSACAHFGAHSGESTAGCHTHGAHCADGRSISDHCGTRRLSAHGHFHRTAAGARRRHIDSQQVGAPGPHQPHRAAIIRDCRVPADLRTGRWPRASPISGDSVSSPAELVRSCMDSTDLSLTRSSSWSCRDHRRYVDRRIGVLDASATRQG